MTSKALALDESFGPDMQALSTQEQMFVCCLFAQQESITRAAEMAGYTAKNRPALREQAHRLLHLPRISAAVVEESKRRTVFLMPKAQKSLATLLDKPEHPDHFKAIKMVREESGLSAAVRKVVDVNVNVTVDDKEKLKKVVEFARARGIDPKTLLGFDPVDAEFTEVAAWETEDVSEFE